jgi:hypothetical protein
MILHSRFVPVLALVSVIAVSACATRQPARPEPAHPETTAENAGGTPSGGIGSQKYTITQPPNATSHFTQEHIIEVGDVPGHKLRVYQVRNEYPQRDFSLAGVEVKELVSDGVSDHVNGSGSFTAYNVLTLVDGNRVFVRVTGTTQSDSAGGNRSASVENFVGGTGKFKGIRGQMRNTLQRAPESKVLRVEVNGEYWIED